MELIIKGTDIFDLDLYEKISQLIKEGNLDFKDELWYSLEVIFHLYLLISEKMNEYYIQYVPKKPQIGIKNRENKDMCHDYLGYVLDNIHEVFKNNNINLDHLTIAGDDIEAEDMIGLTFEISEQKVEKQTPNKRSRQKKPTHIVVHSIIPSRPSLQKRFRKLVEEEINKRFSSYMRITGTKVMSQILEINETNDVHILFREFANQYAHLWNIPMRDEVDKLHEKFRERAEIVLNKYNINNQNNKTNNKF